MSVNCTCTKPRVAQGSGAYLYMNTENTVPLTFNHFSTTEVIEIGTVPVIGLFKAESFVDNAKVLSSWIQLYLSNFFPVYCYISTLNFICFYSSFYLRLLKIKDT